MSPNPTMPRVLPERTMSERDLQGCVIELAHVFRWRCAHFRPALTARGWRTAVEADGAGWPDLFLVRDSRAMAVELKAERGILSAEQSKWVHGLIAAGIETHVWFPKDWVDGTIEASLR